MDISEINEGAERFCAECGRLLKQRFMRRGGEYSHFCINCVRKRREEGVGAGEPEAENEVELDRKVDEILADLLSKTKAPQQAPQSPKRFKSDI